jgi:guanylate kinase
MNKSEKIIILGHSGSGKDFLRKELINLGLKYSPKITTRPKRLNEQDGLDYSYINNKTFESLSNDGKIKYSEKFIINEQDWWYGISEDNWNGNQIFIMTVGEFNQINEEDRKNCFVVYLNIDKETRKSRLSERMDNNDSIDRRIESDEKDFSNFTGYDLSITDPEFEVSWIYDLMN